MKIIVSQRHHYIEWIILQVFSPSLPTQWVFTSDVMPQPLQERRHGSHIVRRKEVARTETTTRGRWFSRYGPLRHHSLAGCAHSGRERVVHPAVLLGSVFRREKLWEEATECHVDLIHTLLVANATENHLLNKWLLMFSAVLFRGRRSQIDTARHCLLRGRGRIADHGGHLLISIWKPSKIDMYGMMNEAWLLGDVILLYRGNWRKEKAGRCWVWGACGQTWKTTRPKPWAHLDFWLWRGYVTARFVSWPWWKTASLLMVFLVLPWEGGACAAFSPASEVKEEHSVLLPIVLFSFYPFLGWMYKGARRPERVIETQFLYLN